MKEIIENHNLEGIISMPSGVFKPYAGVSTAIMRYSRRQVQVALIRFGSTIKADGFSLMTRELPSTIAIFLISLLGLIVLVKKRRESIEQSFVPKEEIVANDYDLPLTGIKRLSTRKWSMRNRMQYCPR